MSFSDPSPAPPLFMPPPFAGGNVGGFRPHIPMNNEHLDSHSQFEHSSPFKRPRNSENNPLNFAPLPPMNARINIPNLSGSRGAGNIFFKTRICAKYLDGNCWNEENCSFAHGPKDLRNPPPNWQEIVREKERGIGNWNDDQRIIHRMKICKRFYNGEECPYGDRCNFLHEPSSKFKTDMATPWESSAISIGTTESRMGHRTGSDQAETNTAVNAGLDDFPVNMKPVFWKTRLCSKWEADQCPFGERCHFAHGLSELQVPGGFVAAEVTTNNGSIQPKPLFIPANDASPTKAVVGAPEGEKRLSKWKETKKINHIYGDWIDDLMPPHCFHAY